MASIFLSSYLISFKKVFNKKIFQWVWIETLPEAQRTQGIESIRDVAQKKRENVGILKKKNRGGGLPESHFHFLLFLTWETPNNKCS